LVYNKSKLANSQALLAGTATTSCAHVVPLKQAGTRLVGALQRCESAAAQYQP